MMRLIPRVESWLMWVGRGRYKRGKVRGVVVNPQLERRKISDWNGLDWHFFLYDLMQFDKIGYISMMHCL